MQSSLINDSIKLLAAAAVLALIAPVQAQISTTSLFAHYDADLQTYANGAKLNSEPGVLATDGERVWEWWDQVTGDGNQIVQNNNNTLQPFLRVGALNGHNYIDMAPVEGGTNTAGLLAIDNVDGTDPFGEPMDSTNQVSYTLVFKNNAPDDTTQTRYAVVFSYNDGLPGGQNTFGTRFANGQRYSYTLDTTGAEQGVTNDATIVGTDWCVLSVVWDGVAGTIKEYVNGHLTGTNTNAGNTNVLNLGRYRLGADQANGFSTRLDGAVAEYLLYSTAISDVDRAATEQFLRDKYLIYHPGDANGDDIVNLADLQILGDNWQSTTAGWHTADFTGDGTVNLADLQILGDNWGFGVGADLSFDEALALTGISIPEPTSLVLLSLGAVGLLRRRATV